MTDRVDTEAITARLTAYNKHKNDPYAYYEGEIEAVRELRRCAPGDIAALLAEVARLREAPSDAELVAFGERCVHGYLDFADAKKWFAERAALQAVEET